MNTVTGIVQVVNVEDVISQFTLSAIQFDSLCLKVTVYPVIAEPPLSGSVHETITSSGYQLVVGATG